MPLRDLLNDINECFQLAEAEDIVQMQRFFLDEAEKPLVAVGSGGSISCACYAALLYGTKNALGSMSPRIHSTQSLTEPFHAPRFLSSVMEGVTKMPNMLQDGLFPFVLTTLPLLH